jgi:hypothetical protein
LVARQAGLAVREQVVVQQAELAVSQPGPAVREQVVMVQRLGVAAPQREPVALQG